MALSEPVRKALERRRLSLAIEKKRESVAPQETSDSTDRDLQALPFELIGGTAAQFVPAPVPPFVKSAVGEGAGRLAFELSRPFFGEELQDPLDIAKDVGKSAITGGIGDFAGGKLLKGFSKLGAPLKKGAVEAGETLSKFTQKGFAPLTASQASEGFLTDTIEGAVENAFLGGRLRKLKDVTQPKALESVTKNFVDSLGSASTPRQAGLIFQDISSGNKKAWNESAQRLYDNIDEVLGGTIENVPIIEEVATGVLDSAGKMITQQVQTGARKEIVGGARIDMTRVKGFVEDVIIRRGEIIQKVAPGTPGTSILNQMLGVADNAPFSNAQFLRSNLLRVAREEGISSKVAGKIAGMIDETMEAGAKHLDGPAKDAWRRANKFFKGGSKRFNSDLGVKLAKAHPSEIVKTIFSGSGTPDKIKNARKIIGEKGWKDVKASFLQSVFDGSLVPGSFPTEGAIKATGLSSKLRSFGTDALEATFTKQEISGLKNILNIADFTQRKVSTPGKLAMQFAQVGAGIGLVTFDNTGAGASVIFGPWMISQLMTRPSTALLMAKGLRRGKTARGGFSFGARLIAEATKIAASNPDKEDMTELSRPEAEGILGQGVTKTFTNPIPPSFNPEQTISQGQ